jgi:hypothetical protein
MLPRYHVSVGGRDVYLAERLFRAGAHRTGIIGYVQEDANPNSPYVARTFYLSNSQAVFRYLPGIVAGWYHKGHDEQSVTLPPILQAAIFQVRVESGIRPVAEAEDRHRMLQGSSRLEPRHLASTGADAGLTANKVVQSEGRRIGDQSETEGKEAPLPSPNDVIIKQRCDCPDFAQPVFSYIAEAPAFSTGLPELLAKRGVTDTAASVLTTVKHNDIQEGSEAFTFEPVEGVVVALGKEFGCWKVRSITVEGDDFMVNPELPGHVPPVEGGAPKSAFDSSPEFMLLDCGSYTSVALANGARVTISPDQRVERVEYNGEVCEILYGALSANVFRSAGRETLGVERLDFTFMTDSQCRTMIASVQPADAPITSVGVSRKWCDARALTAPLYEYASQAVSWGDPSDIRSEYVGMWNRYLHHIPVIREYQRRYLSIEQ